MRMCPEPVLANNRLTLNPPHMSSQEMHQHEQQNAALCCDVMWCDVVWFVVHAPSCAAHPPRPRAPTAARDYSSPCETAYHHRHLQRQRQEGRGYRAIPRACSACPCLLHLVHRRPQRPAETRSSGKAGGRGAPPRSAGCQPSLCYHLRRRCLVAPSRVRRRTAPEQTRRSCSGRRSRAHSNACTGMIMMRASNTCVRLGGRSISQRINNVSGVLKHTYGPQSRHTSRQ